MCPPAQVALIDADLAALGQPIYPPPRQTFDAPKDGVSGVVWAIAGSSMGNRSILADLRRSSPQFPAAFLADPAMPAFFKVIRPRLAKPAKSPAQLAASIEAARAVFACFSSAATASREIA
jgi:heme oxygenase